MILENAKGLGIALTVGTSAATSGVTYGVTSATYGEATQALQREKFDLDREYAKEERKYRGLGEQEKDLSRDNREKDVTIGSYHPMKTKYGMYMNDETKEWLLDIESIANQKKINPGEVLEICDKDIQNCTKLSTTRPTTVNWKYTAPS